MTIIQLPQVLPSPQSQTKLSLGQAQSAENAKAWQREMERSQMADWFHSAKLPNSDFHPSLKPTAESVAHPKLGAKEPPLIRGSIFITEAVMHGAQPSQDPPTSPLLSLILQKADSSRGVIASTGEAYARYDLGTPNLAQVKPDPNAAQYINGEYPESPVVAREEVIATSVAASNSSPTITPPAIRVHAEWHGKRLLVWLGLNGQIFQQNFQIAGIINDLRHLLAERGETLGSLVCNGRTFFPAENEINLPKE